MPTCLTVHTGISRVTRLRTVSSLVAQSASLTRSARAFINICGKIIHINKLFMNMISCVVFLDSKVIYKYSRFPLLNGGVIGYRVE